MVQRVAHRLDLSQAFTEVGLAPPRKFEAMSIFRIDMLPAREGDCLWIEYGDPDHLNRMLVDGGRKIVWRTL